MKTMRNLFLLCAGLSLFACSSDDDATQQFPEGEGAVTIKIVNPTTRAIKTTSGEDDITVTGDITIKLYHSTAESPGYVTETIEDYNGTSAPQEVTFYGIGTPTKVEVSMNGGLADYNAVPIESTEDNDETDDVVEPNMQANPTSIPVYGETTDFRFSGDKVTNNQVEYVEYDAEVTLEIPVARLEVNIKSGTFENLASVLVKGAYLDNVKPNGTTEETNYYHPNDNNEAGRVGTGGSPLFDDANIDFLSATAWAPIKSDESLQYYAYNFYSNDPDAQTPTVENPNFKLLLNVSAAQGQPVIPATQYAIITNYLDSETQAAVTFKNGQIYRITELVFNGANLQVNEDGTDVAYALTAIVTQAKWGINTITGSWAQ